MHDGASLLHPFQGSNFAPCMIWASLKGRYFLNVMCGTDQRNFLSGYSVCCPAEAGQCLQNIFHWCSMQQWLEGDQGHPGFIHGCGPIHVGKDEGPCSTYCASVRSGLKFRCGKLARRCSEKHICKSKCTKHSMLRPFFEVQMCKNGTPLKREAHLQVKMLKN